VRQLRWRRGRLHKRRPAPRCSSSSSVRERFFKGFELKTAKLLA
jgi:hypothetical protein